MDGFSGQFLGDFFADVGSWGDSPAPDSGDSAGDCSDARAQPYDLCGLAEAKPINDVSVASGLVVTIDGQSFDLGIAGAGTADLTYGGSITLADDRGLSIYADIDGDGAVDHVTTVLFDGSWQTWNTHADGVPSEGHSHLAADGSVGTPAEDSVHHTNEGENVDVTQTTSPSVKQWDAYAWEQEGRGKWH